MSAMSDTYPLDVPYSFPPNPHYAQNMYYTSQSLLYPATTTINDMPRPAFFSYSPDVIKHRKRTSRSQRKLLEDAFKQNPKPSQYTRKLLIHQTGMDRRAIQVWFQNRRAKEKKLAAKAAGGAIPEDGKDDDMEDEVDNARDDLEETAEQQTAASTERKLQQADGGQTPTPPASTSITSPLSTPNADPGPASSNWHPTIPPKPLLAPGEAYNMRRESAPAPLGADIQRPPHSLPPHLTGSEAIHAWSGGTPSSPQAIDNELYAMRRGSLPVFGTPHHSDNSALLRANVCRVTGLPGLPVDPNVRRMSLERSRLRLATHPYAPQVAASNRSFSSPFSGPLMTTAMQNSKPSTAYPSTLPVADWDAFRPSSDSFPSYIRPRRHGSYHSGMYSHVNVTDGVHSSVPPHRPYTEIVPGPLPAPNFSFGTASSANVIPETDGDCNHETHGELSTTNGDLYNQQQIAQQQHRFGSFASISSTETTGSSVTTGSAWFAGSDMMGSSGSGSVEELGAPVSWANHADVRRASCPAPFVYAFSGLHMNSTPASANNVQSHSEGLPLSPPITSTPSEASGMVDLSNCKPETPGEMQQRGPPKLPDQNFQSVYYGDAFDQQPNFHVEVNNAEDFSYSSSLAHVGYDPLPLTSEPTPSNTETSRMSYQFYQ